MRSIDQLQMVEALLTNFFVSINWRFLNKRSEDCHVVEGLFH